MILKDPEIHINTKGPANKKGKIDPSKHLGYLGEFFGGFENAPTSISGAIAILLILIGAFITFARIEIALEYWKSVVLPIVSGLFGYLFGKRQSS